MVHVKKKVPQEKKRSVVYQVPCKGCDQVFIGETNKNLKTQLAQHKQAVNQGDDKNGTCAEVCINTLIGKGLRWG